MVVMCAARGCQILVLFRHLFACRDVTRAWWKRMQIKSFLASYTNFTRPTHIGHKIARPVGFRIEFAVKTHSDSSVSLQKNCDFSNSVIHPTYPHLFHVCFNNAVCFLGCSREVLTYRCLAIMEPGWLKGSWVTRGIPSKVSVFPVC